LPLATNCLFALGEIAECRLAGCHDESLWPRDDADAAIGCECCQLSEEHVADTPPSEQDLKGFGNLLRSILWRQEMYNSALETRLARLESTVEERAQLRAAMDEDISRLHLERDLLQAIHDTQSDHTRRLTNLEDKVDALEDKVDALGGKVDVLEGKMDLVQAGVETIRDLLVRDSGTGS
jgi:predicted RNase H-like nuclease (RuvC/YqgF family)